VHTNNSEHETKLQHKIAYIEWNEKLTNPEIASPLFDHLATKHLLQQPTLDLVHIRARTRIHSLVQCYANVRKEWNQLPQSLCSTHGSEQRSSF
jgi:hypothetical protein